MEGLRFERVRFGYRRRCEVLREVSWSPGNRAALLGPNGAGKSTLFGLGSGALHPRSGSVSVGGCPPRPGSVGWMPQAVHALPGLRCREQVALAGWMSGLTRTTAWRDADRALAAVELDAMGEGPARELSGGQLRRLGIAEVLVSNPSVVLLDEPTVGLDPAQRDRIRTLVTDLAEQCQVIVATHLVEDLATGFDTVTVLVDGEIRFDDSVAAFVALGPPEGSFAERATAAYQVVADGRGR